MITIPTLKRPIVLTVVYCVSGATNHSFVSEHSVLYATSLQHKYIKLSEIKII